MATEKPSEPALLFNDHAQKNVDKLPGCFAKVQLSWKSSLMFSPFDYELAKTQATVTSLYVDNIIRKFSIWYLKQRYYIDGAHRCLLLCVSFILKDIIFEL